MVAPAIVAAGIAAGAGLVGSAWSAYSGRKEAQRNRDFQERMSNTSHQREVEDLRAAGLNPIMSAKLGGSSTPLGAQAQVPDYSAPARDAMSAFQAASNMRLQQAQARNLDADSLNKEVAGRVATRTEWQQIETVIAQLDKLYADKSLTNAQRGKVNQEIRKLSQDIKLLKLDEAHSALDLSRARQESDFYKSFGGKVAPWLDHILGRIMRPR